MSVVASVLDRGGTETGRGRGEAGTGRGGRGEDQEGRGQRGVTGAPGPLVAQYRE